MSKTKRSHVGDFVRYGVNQYDFEGGRGWTHETRILKTPTM